MMETTAKFRGICCSWSFSIVRVRRRRFFAGLAGLTLILCFCCELLTQSLHSRELSIAAAEFNSLHSVEDIEVRASDSNGNGRAEEDEVIPVGDFRTSSFAEVTNTVDEQARIVVKSPYNSNIANSTVHGSSSNAAVVATHIPHVRRRGLITITRRYWEGLGNQLFQFSTMFALARRSNRLPTLRKDEELRLTFDLHDPIVHLISEEDWKVIPWDVVGELHPCSYSPTDGLKAALERDGVHLRLDGYFQSFRYFHDVREELNSLLVFAPNVRDLVTSFIKQLRASSPDSAALQLVGVHVRRGDIVNDLQVRSGGYMSAPATYLANAANYFRKRFGADNVRFIVCSDDMTWSRQNFPVGKLHVPANDTATGSWQNDTIFMDDLAELNGPPHFLKRSRDMHLLASLDHTIMTVGTFGWWAAYLRPATNNGTTIYFAHPFTPNSRLSFDFQNSLDDFYPPDWLAFE